MSTFSQFGSQTGDSLESLIRNAREGVFALDRERHIVAFSKGCERITGFPKSELNGNAACCHEAMGCRDEHGRSLAGSLCPALDVFHGEAPSRVQLMRIRRADGKQVWVETTYSPMHDESGETIGVLGVMRPAEPPGEGESRTTEVLLRTGQETSAPSPSAGAAPAPGWNSNGSVDSGPLDGVLLDVERQEILGALRRSNGQRAKAARSLGISRSRLYRRMDVLGIDPRAVY